jgi:hypothetical protein
MGASWTYNTLECFRCQNPLESDEKDLTIPIKDIDIDKYHYLSQVMNVTVCKECHREWKLKEIGIQ